MVHEFICDTVAHAGEIPPSGGAIFAAPATVGARKRNRTWRAPLVLHRQVFDAPFYRLLDYLVQRWFTGGNVIWGIRSRHVLGPGADWTHRTLA